MSTRLTQSIQAEHRAEYDTVSPKVRAPVVGRDSIVSNRATKTNWKESNYSQSKQSRLWKTDTGRRDFANNTKNKSRANADAKRARAILSHLHTTHKEDERVVQSILSKNLNGFSRYYEGLDGAVLGFALLYGERVYIKDIDELGIIDKSAEKLLAYVEGKYGSSADE